MPALNGISFARTDTDTFVTQLLRIQHDLSIDRSRMRNNITLRHLRAFVAIAERGGYTAAAQ
ncbi:LysR family transcriptional regulator, partial [Mesorhizobium sp. LNHC229A00]|uniref:LysR family transcriptional regulator n=2 Tax=unclassified Mesorhizobium TaxID=325217 RepID=UPI001AEBD924